MLNILGRRKGKSLKFSSTISFILLALSNSVSAVDVDWQDLGQANGTVLNSGATVAANNNACVPGVTSCDATATVTFEIVNDGQGGEIECAWNSSSVCAAYFSDEFGGINDDNLRFAIDATGADNDDYFNMCVEFDRVVEGLSFDLLDIDDSGWDDVAELYYTGAPSATPMLARTDLVNGSAFGDVSTGTDTNRVIAHDPANAAPDNEALGWGAIQPGGGNALNTDDGGNVSVDFGSTQVWGFCMRYWAGPNSDANPPFQWVGLSGLNWTASLPVTLDHFSSDRIGNKLNIEWSTSSESFNIGFNLWGEVDGEWVALNRNFIPSAKINSFAPQKYSRTLKLAKRNRVLTRVGISSVDSTGKEEFFGPFDVGSEYGSQSLPEPIDWQQVVAEKTEKMLANGFIKRNGRWVRSDRVKLGANIETAKAELRFEEEGLVRVTHADLMAAGIDLRGLHANEIAVSRAGAAVPRFVRIGGKQRVFNDASFIDFYAAKLDGDLALYNATNVYRISNDLSLVATARRVGFSDHSASPDADIESPENRIYKQYRHEQDRYYLNVSTTGSPWLDQAIGYGAASTVDFDLDLPSDYLPGSDVNVKLNLMGGFDFTQIEDDHHLTVNVNGQMVFDHAWGGIQGQTFEIQIPADVLNESGNVLSLTANNNTANIGLLLFDNYTVTYRSTTVLSAGSKSFTVAPDIAAKSVTLTVDQRGQVWAYGRDGTGNLVRLAKRRTSHKTADGERIRLLELPLLVDPEAQYLLSDATGFIKPRSIDVLANEIQQTDQADFYIITDSTFVGEELNAYVEFKRATGISTELVSYQDIIDAFGFGFNDPLAIQRFLKSQNVNPNSTSVLLVGGHTYDYLNRTEQSSVSFIPSVYRPNSVIQFSPTDTPIVDLDDDGLADLSVGRWPVRTHEQLKVIIDKSIAWANGEGLANNSSVLLIAESDDSNNNISFSNQLDRIASRYNDQSSSYPGYWSNITRTYAADFADAVKPIADQRAAISQSINEGNAMTIYSGHGSPTSWSFKRLLDVNGINGLEENNNANIVIPLACYTTYFETISNESLANKLLFKPDSGAVMVVGAATLGDYAVNGKMINRIMKYQAKEGASMGQAVEKAKRSLGAKKVPQTNLWTLLGDPTLKFNSGYVHQPIGLNASDDETLGAAQTL